MDNRYYDEIAKCANSFEHFCNNYIKIKSYINPVDADLIIPQDGAKPLILHDFQKRYTDCLLGNRFVIGTKFRQGGFTTVTTAFLLWKFLFKRKENYMVLCSTDRVAVNLGQRFMDFIDLLPDWLKPVLSKDNAHTKVSVETECKIFFGTPKISCGKHIDTLFVDEAAFINKMDSHWKALYPTIANSGRAIILSTPNGNSGWFYKTYNDAKEGRNYFVVFRAEYTELWGEESDHITKLRQNLGTFGFQQEMEQKFLPSGEMFICDNPNAEKKMLEDMGSSTAHVPEWKDDDEMAPFRDKGEHGMEHNEFVSADGNKPTLEELTQKYQEALEEQPVIRPDLAPKSEPHDFSMFQGAKLPMGIYNSTKETGLLFECELKGQCRDDEPDCIREKMEKIDKIDLRKGYSFKCANMNDLAKVFPEITPSKIARVKHPHMNEEFEMTSKNLAEWMEAAEGPDHPSTKYWREAYERQERKQEEIEAKVHGVYPADMLRMAGVISEAEAKEIVKESSTGQGDVLQAILKDSEFPKSLKLDFGDYLEVNGVPTLMSTNSIKNAYMGLAALWDHDRAVKFVSNIVKERLDVLFGFGKG